ncbi:MAG TPA: PPC domain-containing protein [Longimicrobium sp.]|nr:PPC domain-containing protein [Longimicrobium sp.]
MHPSNRFRSLPLLAATLLLAACSDTTSPTRPDVAVDVPGPSVMQVSVTCSADTEARTVRCGEPTLPEGVRGLIVGGQHQYVTLTSSNLTVTPDTFGLDVTVTNLIPQPLGTTNGTTADPAGVRVFFTMEPTSPQGPVTVANPDGTATFTAASQPYYQYAGLLAQNSVSAVKRWKFATDPAVTNFSFTVLVSAAVQYPDGYIDGHPYVLSLDPGETRALGGSVRNAVGTVLPGPIDWSSNAPGTASVSGTQVTAGGSRGFAELTAANGPRSGVYTTAVSVCQSVVVGNGTSLPSSIASTDCFSSYGSANGLPSTSYYGDLFRVSLTAGQTITVTMDSGDDLDTYVLLADATLGFIVAANDDDDEGTLGVGSRLVYTATVSGVYVIEASTFNSLGTGNYTLGVTIS